MNSVNKKAQLVLLLAAELIDNVGWTRHADARNFLGQETSALSPKAISFCGSGAVKKAAKALNRRGWYSTFSSAMRAVNNTGLLKGLHIIGFNDFTANEASDVSGLLRKAAETL